MFFTIKYFSVMLLVSVSLLFFFKQGCFLEFNAKNENQVYLSRFKQRYNFANKGPSSQGYGFSSSHVWIRVGLLRKLSTEELMLLNYGVGEDS